MIPRSLESLILDKLTNTQKGVVLYGARQVGKTTLCNKVIQTLNLKTLTINGDQSRYVDILTSCDLDKIKSLVYGYNMLFVDEAQRIKEIGLALKIIRDNLPNLKLLVTGSSSLDLASKITEPLTGRVWKYHLYPVSFLELSSLYNKVELDYNLEERLVFGSYPEVFSLPSEQLKREYLQNLVDAYLFKDLLNFGGIRNSSKIRDLLKLIAFQVGSQVSVLEIASSLGMSRDTVTSYIDLLEKSFIIFRLKGFSRNLRKEITKMDKIYFYDLGVRNALIDNLKPIKDRNDAGSLWENFLILERVKLLDYTQNPASKYFWRTYTGSELDYVEEREGKLIGCEFKYGNASKKVREAWTQTYKESEYVCINRENYLDFILNA